MLSIGIMTWLHNGNYGTVLQAYALQRYLRSCGYHVTNIDFNATAIEKVKNFILCGNSPRLFLEKFDMARTRKVADSKQREIKEERFRLFLKENFHLTEEIVSYKALKKYADHFDIYICGSDQIWSPNLLNPPYYFSYVNESRKKLAYACSFGVSSIASKKKATSIQGYLRRFTHISVREEDGQRLVRKLLGVDVPTTVDPVFLLTSDEWDSVVSDRIIDDEYAFAYFLSYNEQYITIAKKVAKQLGIKLVMVPATREEYKIEADLIQDAGPAEWISLIKHASIILTDSFHGCVFSLIYEKSLMIFKRFSDTSKHSQNSRIYTLIKQYGLEDRVVTTYNKSQVKEIMQSNAKIKDRIAENVESSKKWLDEAIRE